MLMYKLGEARQLLAAGGLYLNNHRFETDRILETSDLIDGRLAILRAGKDKHALIALVHQ